MSDKKAKIIIAIDGACATGKSTLAKKIAEKLNIMYLDTGAMYRAVSCYFYKNNIELTENNIVNNLDDINIDVIYKNSEMRILLNKEDVSEEIRKNEISNIVSNVAKCKAVRDKLVPMQRQIGENNSLVLDGRDIGTVVFPNADAKLYVVTQIDERVKRRKRDLELKGQIVPEDVVKKELEQRDSVDMNRKESPLKKADDATILDNTKLSFDDTVKDALEIISNKIKER